MSNDSKNNVMVWVAIVYLLIILMLGWSLFDSRRKLADKEAELIEHDSASYRASKEIVKENAMLHERSDSLHRAQGLLRKDVLSWVERAANAWEKERNVYLRQIAQVNTTRSTVPELDSMQFALYGAPPNDSTHTIPLDYSRKLTGDALRLPIEQRMATRAIGMVDSLKGHYGRLVDSYKVDIALFKQDAAADHDAITGLMKNAGEMQGDLNKYRKKSGQNVFITIGAGATADTEGLHYGPQITIGYKIAGFRIRKRK